jgi:hypothetical protein
MAISVTDVIHEHGIAKEIQSFDFTLAQPQSAFASIRQKLLFVNILPRFHAIVKLEFPNTQRVTSRVFNLPKSRRWCILIS